MEVTKPLSDAEIDKLAEFLTSDETPGQLSASVVIPVDSYSDSGFTRTP